jgi:head-tail adaptor
MLVNRLTETIEILSKTETKNDFGAVIESLQPVRVIKAERKSNRFIDRFKQGNFDEQLMEFETRYYPDINIDCVVQYRSERYEIMQMEEMGRKRSLILTCKLIK